MKNNSVKKCCICDNENIGEFIIIDDKKYHLNCITNLQEEKDKYKNVIDKIKEYCKEEKEDLIASGEVCEDILELLEEVE